MKTQLITPTYASVPIIARATRITIPAMSVAGALASAAPRARDPQVGGTGVDSIAPPRSDGSRVGGSAAIASPENLAHESFRAVMAGTVKDFLGGTSLDDLSLIEENY